MAEGRSVATINRSRDAAISDSSSSVKSEKEKLQEEIENATEGGDVEPSKAQHQPIVASAPKRRGKGEYFIWLPNPTMLLKSIRKYSCSYVRCRLKNCTF